MADVILSTSSEISLTFAKTFYTGSPKGFCYARQLSSQHDSGEKSDLKLWLLHFQNMFEQKYYFVGGYRMIWGVGLPR